MTVYERTTFLAGALRSVLIQSVSDFEVIVSDDSNSAAVREIVETFTDPRIRYNPSHSRKGFARNVADSIHGCRGTYIAILNDDDLWEPDFLAALLPPLESDETCVLAFSDHWIMDEEGNVDDAASDANSRQWGRADLPAGPIQSPGQLVVLDKAVPMVMGALFRRSALDTDLITEQVGGACDYWLAVLLASTGRPLHYVPRRTTRYRMHRKMETFRANAEKRDDELFIILQVLSRGWFKEIDSGLRTRFADIAGAVAINKLRFRQASAARSIAWAGLRSSFNLRCLAALAASLSPVLPNRLLFGARKPAE